MRHVPILLAILAASGFAGPALATDVLTYHADAARSGHYNVPGLNYATAPGLHATPGYASGPLSGDVYAQPLYWTPPGGAPEVIAATMLNNVYALDASSGAILWQQSLGPAFTGANSPCVPDPHFSNPEGVYGTPTIDPAGTLYLDAARQTPGNGAQHEIYALDLLNRGATISGWPVDPGANLPAFTDNIQAQHGALLLQGGRLYAPYGALEGDCGNFRGWVIGIEQKSPSQIASFATSRFFAHGGGIWGPGGVVGDGKSEYVASGNTVNTFTFWNGGEALMRLDAGLGFSRNSQDYFAPSDWFALDNADQDLAASAPVFVPVRGDAKYLMALGKGGRAYFVGANMGGVGGKATTVDLTAGVVHNAAAVFVAPDATTVVVNARSPIKGCPAGSNPLASLAALRVTPGPKVVVAWCAYVSGGYGVPIITSDAGGADPIVWVAGAEHDDKLRGLRLDTGAQLVALPVGGVVPPTQAAIAAGGRIYVGFNGGVASFSW